MSAAGTPVVDVVIPAVRAELVSRVLARVAGAAGIRDVLVVWDGEPPRPPLPGATRVVDGRRRGPAAARNAGWRASDADWIAFLDDDVEPEPGWAERLAGDLAAAAPHDAGVQGRVIVPLPPGRPPTDWERNVARLADAPALITADFCCRRAALEAIGGFDERFARAYREDSDLELRLEQAGWRWRRGARVVEHPVREAPWSVSLTLQRGNADDILLWALHGARAQVTFRHKLRYAAVCAAGLAALRGSRLALAAWLAETVRFTWRRAAPGPRTPEELARLATTSAAIPPLAVGWTLRGVVEHRALVARRVRSRTHR